MTRSNNLFLKQTILLLLLLCLLTSENGCRERRQDMGLKIAVSVEPHAFLVERIGGNLVCPIVLVPTGKEPESYQPTPENMIALSRAKVIFCTGMPFESSFIPKLCSNIPDLKVVDLRRGISLRNLELHHHASNSPHHSHDSLHLHESEHASDHGLQQIKDPDPHIWFAPTILKTQVETIRDILIEIDPSGSKIYLENAAKLIEEIELLRLELAEIFLPYKNKTVFVFHPAYGYFCDEFQLQQRAVEFEGKSPKPQQIAELITEIRKENQPPRIFIQPEFSTASAESLAEQTGTALVVHSPLERNIIHSMKQFAEYFKK